MSQIKAAHIRWVELCKNIQEQTTINFSESPAEKEQRKKKLLKDYDAFVQYYFPHYTIDKATGKHVACADFHIEWAKAVLKNKHFKGVAEWPREHAKSVHNDIFIPMWLKAHGELDGMVLGGKNEDDAKVLLGDLQAELEKNRRYINDWGQQHSSGSWEEGDFTTRDGAYFMAIGRGQSPRGIRKGSKRPNYGCLDDIDDDEIVNNLDRVERVVDWILGGFMGTLDIRQSRFIMSGNRIHPKSILAHIVGDIDDNTAKREGIYHSKIFATTDGALNGPPTWHQKYTAEILHARFAFVGYYMALREYFHRAVIKGKIFRNEWMAWDKIPRLQDMDNIVGYFDPSYKPKTTNDFKAISVWGNTGIRLYKIDQFCRQVTITQAVKWLYDFHETLPNSVASTIIYLMEEVFLQDMFFDDFEAEAKLRGYYLPIRGDKSQKPDKYARIEQTTAYYERGLVIWNEAKKKSPDMQNALAQLLGFQKGATIHDDAPDADEGAIHKLLSMSRSAAFAPKLGRRENRNQY